MGANPLTPEQEHRFWAKVPDRPEGECWEWQGAREARGYGKFVIDGRRGHQKTLKAHRVSYTIHKGPIPPGQVVRHLCDNPCCVAPHHLELGTQGDNVHDCETRGRAYHPAGVGNG